MKPAYYEMFRKVVAVMAVGILAGCAEPEVVPPARRAVRTVTVEKRDIGTATRYSGSLEPREKLDLTFKIGGKVRSLAMVGEAPAQRLIQEGDRVQKGQVLAVLEDDDARTQVRAAAAGVATADAQVQAAEATLRQATTELERARSLRQTGSLSQAEFERAQTAVKSARANVDSARSQRVAKSEQQALARGVVEDATLASPLDGLLARRNVEVGSTASPGLVAFTLIDTATMKVVFGVPDLRISSVRLGDRVPVHLDALPGRVLAGEVTKVHPVADPQVRSFAVEVTLSNTDGELRAGMVATAALASDEVQGALLVPLSSVVRPPRADGFAVWVLDAKSGKVALRVIEPGDLSGNDLVVLKGLQPGERVVADGAPLLHEGEAVEVLP